MKSAIPFVNGTQDSQMVRDEMAGCETVRLLVSSVFRDDSILRTLPRSTSRWIDPVLEGLGGWRAQRAAGSDEESDDSWTEFVRTIPQHETILRQDFHEKPDASAIAAATEYVLEKCRELDAAWITVPQRPYGIGGGSNKINKRYAEATAMWAQAHRFAGGLVVPAVIEKAAVMDSKTERKRKITVVKDVLAITGARLVWIVDKGLRDWELSKSGGSARLPKLVALHEELHSECSRAGGIDVIAGPYWAMNLVLWARGLCKWPGIACGTGPRYHSPGGFIKKAVSRVFVRPLLRLERADGELRRWLDMALDRLDKGTPARGQLEELRQNIQRYMDDRLAARQQVVRGYTDWVRRLEATPPEGRCLALYQDFSSAYVLGTRLPNLPGTGPGRQAGAFAKAMMMNCLD